MIREQLLNRYIPYWHPILSCKGKSSSHLRIVVYICQALTCFTTKFSFKRNSIIKNCVLSLCFTVTLFCLPHSMVSFFVSDCISTIVIAILCIYVQVHSMGVCANVCKIVQKCLYNCADSLRIVIAFYGHTLAGGCFICHGDIMAPSDCSFVQQIKQTNTQTKTYIWTLFGYIIKLSWSTWHCFDF